MVRLASFALSLALAAAPAAAANYSATLAVPSAGRIIARDIVWNCDSAACQGATDESRPLVLCESLAKHAGSIRSFVVDGRELDATSLQRCNAEAKPAAPSAVAAK